MSANANDVIKDDYKVADLSLATWGRKEIAIAETEMPRRDTRPGISVSNSP